MVYFKGWTVICRLWIMIFLFEFLILLENAGWEGEKSVYKKNKLWWDCQAREGRQYLWKVS